MDLEEIESAYVFGQSIFQSARGTPRLSATNSLRPSQNPLSSQQTIQQAAEG
jgi:hypothetical protein